MNGLVFGLVISLKYNIIILYTLTYLEINSLYNIMDNSLDADLYIEQKPEPEPIPDLEYTDNGNLKHNYYCEYKFCFNRYCKLVPFKKDNDWNLRMLHKKCFKSINEIKIKLNKKQDNLIVTNPLNPIFDKCKCNKLDGKPCTMKSNTEGFNKKFGYCKYHNTRKFHSIYH